MKLNIQQSETLVDGWGWVVHLRVCREDGKAGISWDKLQQIKNEYAGPYARAIEVYPSEHELVNEINARHLWIVPDGVSIPNLWRH